MGITCWRPILLEKEFGNRWLLWNKATWPHERLTLASGNWDYIILCRQLPQATQLLKKTLYSFSHWYFELGFKLVKWWSIGHLSQDAIVQFRCQIDQSALGSSLPPLEGSGSPGSGKINKNHTTSQKYTQLTPKRLLLGLPLPWVASLIEVATDTRPSIALRT